MTKLTRDRADLSGQKIGNYELDELLKPRSVSDFYIGRDVKLDRPVFVEILNATEELDPGLVDRFQRRTDTVSQLKDPYIAPVVDVGVSEDGHPYAVLEYIAGDWLSNILADWRQDGYTLPVDEALILVRDIAEALSVAHSAGLVDPDLRPENILISDDNNKPILMNLIVPVTGKSRDSVLTNGQSQMLDYASPEESEGKAIGRRSNIYSIGIILFELLTGHRPRLPTSSWDIFERSTMPKEVPLEEEREGLSGETYRLVRSCLWRQEWSRFESADELITAIDTAILAEQSLPKATLWTNQRRRWLYVAVPVIALLFIIFGLGLVWSQFANAQQGRNSDSPTIAAVEPTSDVNNSGEIVGLGTPEPTATVTREAPPTSAAGDISVFTPIGEQSFAPQDLIDFAWIWLTVLGDSEVFSVYLLAEDNGGEAVLVGTVEEPDNASLYRIKASADDLGLGGGFYLWQVRLEDRNSGKMIVESDPQRLLIIEEPTATPTSIAPTATPTQTPTEIPSSPSPTVTVCVPAAPFGWITHRVQAGENIFFYAQRANVRVEDILEANCLARSTVLSVGQQLFIPAPLVTNTPTPNPIPSFPTQPPFDPGDGGAPGNGGGNNGGGNGGDTDPPDPPSNPTTPPTVPDV
ncbi:MAG: protein kinase [Candidatus Promineifilaceae bacterium]|nr:protein kinase [Candidatus Promineifilaceae bacterium]